MNRQKWMLLVLALAMIAGSMTWLGHLSSHRRLGLPAVKTHPLSNSIRLEVELPERVLDYTSTPLEVAKIVLDYLPPDTSFGQRRYVAPDAFWIQMTAVLMGADRTSLHKPQLCLGGSGLQIEDAQSHLEKVPIQRPYPYTLPVMKLLTTRASGSGGPQGVEHYYYVYWFVADGELTASHSQRMWWMARDVLRTGVLQRWAYIACLCPCPRGMEDAAFDRLKKFIGGAVPQFQLTPPPRGPAVASRH